MQTAKKSVKMIPSGVQMSPHFIFNCLNSINRYIVKSDQATASLYLTKFARLVRLTMDSPNNSALGTLADEVETLSLYLEMEAIRFENKFRYSIDIDKDINKQNIHIPLLVFQPYVENAIWYGLLNKQSAGELKISMRMESSKLLKCVIEDDGIGRQKAKELKRKSIFTNKSLSINQSEKLTLYTCDATDVRVEVEDKYNLMKEPAGTRVTINIPVDC